MAYIGSTPTTQSFIAGTDYFNGTGSQVAFTLSRSVNSVNDIEVIVNNVEQIPSGYLVSGTTLTFSAAPSAGTSNVYVRYLSTTNLSLAIPAGTSASFNTVTATSLTATTLAATNLSYTGTLTGGTGVVNLGSGQVYKDASGNVGIGTSSPVAVARASFGNSASAASLWAAYFGTNSALSGAAPNFGLTLGWNKSNGGGESNIVYGTGAGSSPALAFASSDGTTLTERARIDSSGNLLVGTTSAVPRNLTSGSGIRLGSAGQIEAAGGADTNFINITAASGNMLSFRRQGGGVGDISTNGTTTTYGTVSDYRLKEDIAPMTGALAKVAALRPCTYKWKSNGSASQGFIAHELQEVVPDCVTGEKDAVDADGNPQYQGIDTSFLVATLAAAIQELKAIVDAQGAEIAALKGTP